MIPPISMPLFYVFVCVCVRACVRAGMRACACFLGDSSVA